jgi:hypothetical protein
MTGVDSQLTCPLLEPSHKSFRVNTLHAVVSVPLGRETKYLVPETSPQPTTTTGEGSGRRTRILAPRVPNRIRCVTQAATCVRVFFASTEGLLILPRALRCVALALHHPGKVAQNIFIRQRGAAAPSSRGRELGYQILFFPTTERSSRAAGQLIAPRPRSRRFLAFRPECNPPARTTPASRTHHPL